MSPSTIQQIYIFFTFILVGFLIGLLFDIFRVLRKIVSTKNIHTYIQDFLFSITASIVVIYALFKFNNGEIRIYIIISIISGIYIYFNKFSKYFIKFNLSVFIPIKNILSDFIRNIRNIRIKHIK